MDIVKCVPLIKDLINPSKRVICTVDGCGEELYRPAVKKHMKSKHGRDVLVMYFCPVVGCDRSEEQGRPFDKIGGIRQHYKAVHLRNGTSFTCNRCDMKFESRYFLKMHKHCCGHRYACSCNALFSCYHGMRKHAKKMGHQIPLSSKLDIIIKDTATSVQKTKYVPKYQNPALGKYKAILPKRCDKKKSSPNDIQNLIAYFGGPINAGQQPLTAVPNKVEEHFEPKNILVLYMTNDSTKGSQVTNCSVGGVQETLTQYTVGSFENRGLLQKNSAVQTVSQLNHQVSSLQWAQDDELAKSESTQTERFCKDVVMTSTLDNEMEFASKSNQTQADWLIPKDNAYTQTSLSQQLMEMSDNDLNNISFRHAGCLSGKDFSAQTTLDHDNLDLPENYLTVSTQTQQRPSLVEDAGSLWKWQGESEDSASQYINSFSFSLNNLNSTASQTNCPLNNINIGLFESSAQLNDTDSFLRNIETQTELDSIWEAATSSHSLTNSYTQTQLFDAQLPGTGHTNTI